MRSVIWSFLAAAPLSFAAWAAGDSALGDRNNLPPPSGKSMSDSSIECKIDNTEPTLARALAKPRCDPATREGQRTTPKSRSKDDGSSRGGHMTHQDEPASSGSSGSSSY